MHPFARLTVQSIGLCFMGLSICEAASAQTATPSILAPLPPSQSIVDRAGIDRSTGRIGKARYESISIGNQYANLQAHFNSNGVINHAAYLQIERVSIYAGGFMVVRAAARGSVHLFTLGTISQTTHPQTGQVQWGFNPSGTSTGPTTSDTYHDFNDDGAILVCTGDGRRMHRGGICSLYLGVDGTRTDFRMPSVDFDSSLRNLYLGYSTSSHVAYAWPTRTVMADGEELNYIYTNYAEQNWPSGHMPAPTKWNAIETSLGYRVYLPAITPNSGGNPGAMHPTFNVGTGGALHAINTSLEYADPATSSRSFGAASFSSVKDQISSNQSTLVSNGIPIITLSSSAQSLSFIKPNGGVEQYTGGLLGGTSFHGRAGGPSTPFDAFPSMSFSYIGNSVTSYSVTYNNNNYTPERYFGTVSNPDGSTESFVVQYGLIQSQTDGLGRQTVFGWSGQEGYFYGIPGYARLTRLTSITRPDGSGVSYAYTHGGVSSHSVQPPTGGTVLTTSIGLAASCTVQNYRICNKPTYIRDPKLSQTDFVYDPVHGGLLSETLPPDASGVRPQKRYTYSQLYPKTLNAGGQLVSGPPVWRLTRASECVSASPSDPASCVGTASEKITVYDYGSNNLFLMSKTDILGDGSTSRTVNYTYDYAGNLTSEDGPRIGANDVSYTTYDKLRRKIFEISPGPDEGGALPRIIVRHVYDADGNEIATEYGTGTSTDGSDFIRNRFDRLTYDPKTGDLLKKEALSP